MLEHLIGICPSLSPDGAKVNTVIENGKVLDSRKFPSETGAPGEKMVFCEARVLTLRKQQAFVLCVEEAYEPVDRPTHSAIMLVLATP